MSVAIQFFENQPSLGTLEIPIVNTLEESHHKRLSQSIHKTTYYSHLLVMSREVGLECK